MTTLQERMAEVFPPPAARGLQAEIAKLCDVKPASVSAWFKNPEKVASISRTNAEKLCTHFKLKVSPAWLAEGLLPKFKSASAGEGEMLAGVSLTPEQSNVTDGPSIKGVYPLLSSVQAGAWAGLCEQFQSHHAQEWLPSTKNLGKCGYMLRVEGKSMENPGGRHNFSEGMVLHVNPNLTPDPGQYVVVRRNGTQEATFKRYVLIDGAKYLEAINPDWPKEMKYLPLQPGDEWCGVVVDASLGGLI